MLLSLKWAIDIFKILVSGGFLSQKQNKTKQNTSKHTKKTKKKKLKKKKKTKKK